MSSLVSVVSLRKPCVRVLLHLLFCVLVKFIICLKLLARFCSISFSAVVAYISSQFLYALALMSSSINMLTLCWCLILPAISSHHYLFPDITFHLSTSSLILHILEVATSTRSIAISFPTINFKEVGWNFSFECSFF